MNAVTVVIIAGLVLLYLLCETIIFMIADDDFHKVFKWSIFVQLPFIFIELGLNLMDQSVHSLWAIDQFIPSLFSINVCWLLFILLNWLFYKIQENKGFRHGKSTNIFYESHLGDKLKLLLVLTIVGIPAVNLYFWYLHYWQYRV